MKRIDAIKYGAIGLFVVEIILALVLQFVFYMRFASLMLIVLIIDAGYVFWMVTEFQKQRENDVLQVRELLDRDSDDAIRFGEVGIVTYNEEFIIQWMSDYFITQGINYVGEKITSWIPELAQLIGNDTDRITASYGDKRFIVERLSSTQSLFFRDVTELMNLKETHYEEETVVGLIHLDNYQETVQYEDEQKIALINANMRQRVADWCKEHGMMARRIRTDRFIVITDRRHYEAALNEKFSILNEIRSEAAALETSITLSMAFATGTSDYLKLDEMVNDLLELAQNRGGDQAAVRENGGDVQFIGGATESSERRSGVRIRVMAQTIRGLMEKSDRILIVGHRVSDFDCMAGMLGVSRMASYLGKEAYVVARGFPLEAKLTAALAQYNEELETVHHFITSETALSKMTENSLVVVVDHHTVDQCATPEVILQARKSLIIDHHRRRADDNIRASMVYLESSASSTAELLVEFLQYQPQTVELLPEECNIMLAGMVVDTNHFRNRCGARTFEAASQLRSWGADPLEVDDLLKNDYQEFVTQNKLLSYSQKVYDKYIIAPIVSKETFTRAALSEAADFLLSIQGVKASFVIANVAEDTVAISARSAGEVNVQVLMEKMKGGGHFAAAAVQRHDTTVQDMTGELVSVLEAMEEEERIKNESNTAD